MKVGINYSGKDKTFIRVNLLSKAKKGDYVKDVIKIKINSMTDFIEGVMTEEEAIILANGLLNAVTLKMLKDKRI